MKKSEITKLITQLEKMRIDFGTIRDKYREVLDDFQEILDNADEADLYLTGAKASLEEAIDKMSELV